MVSRERTIFQRSDWPDYVSARHTESVAPPAAERPLGLNRKFPQRLAPMKHTAARWFASPKKAKSLTIANKPPGR